MAAQRLHNFYLRKAYESRIDCAWQQVEDLDARLNDAVDEYNASQRVCIEKGMSLFAMFPHVRDDKIDEYSQAISAFVVASLSVTCIFYRLGDAQDRYNEAVIAYEDRYLAAPVEAVADTEDMDDDDGDEDETVDAYVDVEVFVRERKTRKNVLGVRDAVKANKVNKNHKMKPRTVKRDRTKTEEAKERTRGVVRSRASLSDADDM
jgi:hypothetical protein